MRGFNTAKIFGFFQSTHAKISQLLAASFTKKQVVFAWLVSKLTSLEQIVSNL